MKPLGTLPWLMPSLIVSCTTRTRSPYEEIPCVNARPNYPRKPSPSNVLSPAVAALPEGSRDAVDSLAIRNGLQHERDTTRQCGVRATRLRFEVESPTRLTNSEKDSSLCSNCGQEQRDQANHADPQPRYAARGAT